MTDVLLGNNIVSLVGIVKGIVVGVGVVVVATGSIYGGIFGFSNLKYNTERLNSDGFVYSVQRADWNLGKTRLTKYRGGDTELDSVYQKTPFKRTITIYDGGKYGPLDGRVDCIDNGTLDLNRDDDYSEFQKEFDSADRLLAETKERFKDHF